MMLPSPGLGEPGLGDGLNICPALLGKNATAPW
jgi:hypothetical protein